MGGLNFMSEAARDSIGYLGGSLLAIAMLPQVLRIWVTKSAADVSLLWTLLFLGGISFTLAYLVLLGHLAGWLPTAFEVLLGVVTVILKVLMDHTEWGAQQKQRMQEQQLQQQVLQHCTQPATKQDDDEVRMHNLDAAAAAADQCSHQSIWSWSNAVRIPSGTVGNAAAAAACKQLAISAESQLLNLAAATAICADEAQEAEAAEAAVGIDMSSLSSADIHLHPVNIGSSSSSNNNARQPKWFSPTGVPASHVFAAAEIRDLGSSNSSSSSSSSISPPQQQQQQQHQTIAAAAIPVQLASGSTSQSLLPTTIQICSCCGALHIFEQAPFQQHDMQQVPIRTASSSSAAILPLHKSNSGDASALHKYPQAGVNEQQSAHRLELCSSGG